MTDMIFNIFKNQLERNMIINPIIANYRSKTFSNSRPEEKLNNPSLVDITVSNTLVSCEKISFTSRMSIINHNKRIQNVLIPSSQDKGLNKIIGCTRLKNYIYHKILTPLCETMNGKNRKTSIPNGINFFGPKGTGKTFFARQLGEHYALKGGYYEELDLSGDINTDVKYLKAKFAKAQERFEASGRKKYSILFIDEIEKFFDKKNSQQKPVLDCLLELTNKCRRNGIIFVSTANYLDRIEPSLLSNGRTDLRIPIGYIENNDLKSMIKYYIKKDALPVEDDIDFNGLGSCLRGEYKPRDIERKLLSIASDFIDRDEKMDASDIERAFIETEPNFDNKECTLFNIDKAYAKSLSYSGGSQDGINTDFIKKTIWTNGLYDIIGFADAKKQLYEQVLKPLSEVMSGKGKQCLVPSEISFFGPEDTGKTYFAKKLGEHYVQKGGYFEELGFPENEQEALEYLKEKTSEARDRFVSSGRKKYTLFFIDDLDKIFPNYDSSKSLLENKLERLINNGKDKGIIIVSTVNHFNNLSNNLFRNGPLHIKIPIGYVDEDDFINLINYYIKKYAIPCTEEFNSSDIKQLSAFFWKSGKIKCFKAKEIEQRLVQVSKYYIKHCKEMTKIKIIKALEGMEDNNNQVGQFRHDLEWAKDEF